MGGGAAAGRPVSATVLELPAPRRSRPSRRVLTLRAIPILGWLYLAAGALAAARGRAPDHRLLRALWWLDLFLSVVVHAAQVPVALRAAGPGADRVRTAALTQIFGLTWWRTAGRERA